MDAAEQRATKVYFGPIVKACISRLKQRSVENEHECGICRVHSRTLKGCFESLIWFKCPSSFSVSGDRNFTGVRVYGRNRLKYLKIKHIV